MENEKQFYLWFPVIDSNDNSFLPTACRKRTWVSDTNSIHYFWNLSSGMETFLFRTQRLTLKWSLFLSWLNTSYFSYYGKSLIIFFISVWRGARSGVSSVLRDHITVALPEILSPTFLHNSVHFLHSCLHSSFVCYIEKLGK